MRPPWGRCWFGEVVPQLRGGNRGLPGTELTLTPQTRGLRRRREPAAFTRRDVSPRSYRGPKEGPKIRNPPGGTGGSLEDPEVLNHLHRTPPIEPLSRTFLPLEGCFVPGDTGVLEPKSRCPATEKPLCFDRKSGCPWTEIHRLPTETGVWRERNQCVPRPKGPCPRTENLPPKSFCTLAHPQRSTVFNTVPIHSCSIHSTTPAFRAEEQVVLMMVRQ
jgi:hypothetical protein